MRIIGGEARSRLIDAPRGMDTRPTQDKVRESLFNILQGQVQDSCVLDLFAGSGALGLEAISRGARYAVFVDSARQAAAIVQANADKLGFHDRAKVVQADWRAAVTRLSAQSAQAFDLIFMDPPYKMENTGEMCRHLLDCGVLAPEAMIVIEHDWDTPPKLPDAFRVTDIRRYGSTGITFCTPCTKEESV